MSAKQHGLEILIVRLTDKRAELNGLIDKGEHPARKLLKARILLKADASAPFAFDFGPNDEGLSCIRSG